ncbi:hypothetical protein DAEQUDRAFT_254604 [Daedalea quercina L-15889]|uniref:Uncharacterized protein n=1 Tax=Daedalea quercina L-15889 TaxID=1314783 RepID=A0A165QI86_9APHY|nr:hypothetical protein DAEQUDRAFT_254604 [Daedalea quercina L-15889]
MPAVPLGCSKDAFVTTQAPFDSSSSSQQNLELLATLADARLVPESDLSKSLSSAALSVPTRRPLLLPPSQSTVSPALPGNLISLISEPLSLPLMHDRTQCTRPVDPNASGVAISSNVSQLFLQNETLPGDVHLASPDKVASRVSSSPERADPDTSRASPPLEYASPVLPPLQAEETASSPSSVTAQQKCDGPTVLGINNLAVDVQSMPPLLNPLSVLPRRTSQRPKVPVIPSTLSIGTSNAPHAPVYSTTTTPGSSSPQSGCFPAGTAKRDEACMSASIIPIAGIMMQKPETKPQPSQLEPEGNPSKRKLQYVKPRANSHTVRNLFMLDYFTNHPNAQHTKAEFDIIFRGLPPAEVKKYKRLSVERAAAAGSQPGSSQARIGNALWENSPVTASEGQVVPNENIAAAPQVTAPSPALVHSSPLVPASCSNAM